MSGAQPDSVAVRIFNEIGQTDLYDVERTKNAFATLVRLRKQMPGNFGVAVAFSIGALKLGRRLEAIDALNHAYGLKQISDLMPWCALADLSVIVGEFERGQQLYRALIEVPGALAVPQILINGSNSALLSGDIELLVRLDRAARGTGGKNQAGTYLDLLRGSHLEDVIGDHQQIVNAVLKDFRTWMMPEISLDDSGDPTLVIRNYVAANRAERIRLDGVIFDTLCAHYQGLKRRLADVLPQILNTVEAAPEAGFVPFSVAS